MKSRFIELNIENKIVFITSDGASNIQAAFDVFYEVNRIWCVAHRIHLVICNGLGLWKKFRKNDANENGGDDLIEQQPSFDSFNDQDTDDHSMEVTEESDGKVFGRFLCRFENSWNQFLLFR